jgi:hypothetical protein
MGGGCCAAAVRPRPRGRHWRRWRRGGRAMPRRPPSHPRLLNHHPNLLQTPPCPCPPLSSWAPHCQAVQDGRSKGHFMVDIARPGAPAACSTIIVILRDVSCIDVPALFGTAPSHWQHREAAAASRRAARQAGAARVCASAAAPATAGLIPGARLCPPPRPACTCAVTGPPPLSLRTGGPLCTLPPVPNHPTLVPTPYPGR